jgi:hypothetical protein
MKAADGLKVHMGYDRKDYYWVCVEELGWMVGEASGYGTCVGFSKDFNYVLVPYHFTTKEWNAHLDDIRLDMEYMADFAPFYDGYASLDIRIFNGVDCWIWDVPMKADGTIDRRIKKDPYRHNVYLRYYAAKLDDINKDCVSMIDAESGCLWRHGEYDTHWIWGPYGTAQEILDDPNLEAIQRINRMHTDVYVEAYDYGIDATDELADILESLQNDNGNIPLDSYVDALEGVSA